MTKHARARAAIAAVLLCLGSADAAVGDPFGSEYRVNTTTAGAQTVPAVAMDPYGGYVVTWTHTLDDGTTDIHAQRYQADGSPASGEFRVNTSTAGNQTASSVAMDASGNYVVTWAGPDTSSHGVYAQRFNSADVPQGDETLVPTVTANSQFAPDVAMDAAGNYVITWESLDAGTVGWRVWARMYGADGVAKGAAFRVDPTITMHHDPRVAMDADGDFAIAWHGFDGGYYNGIWYRRYAADGTALSAPYLVHWGTGPGWTWSAPDIAMDAAGNVAVVWQDLDSYTGTKEIFASTHRVEGGPGGSLQRVNTTTAGDQTYPKVAMSAQGAITVVWHSAAQDGSGNGVYAQRLGLDGAKVGSEAPANTFTAGNQEYPAVALDADGDGIAVWQSDAQDGSAHGIYAQRYTGGTVNLRLYVHGGGGWPYDLPYSYTIRVSSEFMPNYGVGVPAIDAAISSATNVKVRDELPAGVSYLGFEGGDRWWCTATGQVVDCDYDAPLLQDAMTSLVIHVQPSAPGSFTSTATLTRLQHDNSPYDDTSSATTTFYDEDPDPISFVDQTGVPRSTLITSEPVTISGITRLVSLTVYRGTVSVNGGPFTDAQQWVSNGASIRVQHVSSANFLSTVDTIVRIQDQVVDTFSSTTAARDDVPDAFAFSSVTDVALGSETVSSAVTPAGFNAPTPIDVAGGEYSLDGGPYTSSGGSIAPGQSVRVRHVASSEFSTTVTTTLTIGGVSAAFSSTTLARDETPDAFGFGSASDALRSALVVSSIVVPTGINAPAPVSVVDGEYSIDGGPFSSATGSLSPGQTVRVRHVASPEFSTTVTTTLTIGGVAGTFSSTTLAVDTAPDAFAFADVSGALPRKRVTSGIVVISGINAPAPISVAGGDGEYRIDGGSWTRAAGSIGDSQTLQLRVVSPVIPGASVDVTVNVGGVTDTWRVTTLP